MADGDAGKEMTVRYLSLCSGIEAASVAWRPLGWQPVAFAEIEPFPCAVLAHHYPDVPNLGDMTQVRDWRPYHGAVDLVVAGTPCQDFSIAGKRAGLSGKRSGLALAFAQVLSVVRPEWIVWENVPGVFSTNGGRDFGTFLRALDDIGYSCAWRVLDAQYFGIPQRRRRVFVVGHLGDWRPAAAVLFEREGVCGDFQKRRTEGGVFPCLTAKGGTALDDRTPYVLDTAGVRRTTPLEWERLMGFPDGYTAIEYLGRPAADAPRYKALGNSMAVPVMRWIGERISRHIKNGSRSSRRLRAPSDVMR